MLINSDDSRIAKKVIQQQEADGYEECWFANLKQDASMINIEVEESNVKEVKKSVWKKNIKGKIKEAFEAKESKYVEIKIS